MVYFGDFDELSREKVPLNLDFEHITLFCAAMGVVKPETKASMSQSYQKVNCL